MGDGTDAWRALNAKLLESIARHHVPAIGFVNELKLEAEGSTDPARVALLKAWVDAGLELGNHTFSHRDLHRASLQEYETEIVRGEAVTRGLLQRVGRKPRYFRHPQLHSGRDLATKGAVESFLAKRGYAVAPVTVDNSEWVFAKAYELASERGDRAAAERVAAAYVPYMAAMFDYCERQSRALFGREIRQVLLLHANSLNAERFDELARMMKARGYAFVPLAEALRDPAYRSKDTWVGGEGITWLHRWAFSSGRREAILPDEPRTPEFVMKESGIAAE